VLAVFMVTAALPRPAFAQDKRTQARALLVAGQKLYSAGEYAEALSRFERAYALVPSPRIQFNFGLAYMMLDRPSDAMRAFEAFIAGAGDASGADVAKAQANLGRLDKKVAVLELEGDTSGAEVAVDGRSYGSVTRVVLDPGPHQLTIDKPGRPPFLSKLKVAAAARVRIPVQFGEPAPVTVPPPASSRTPAVATATPPPLVGLPALVPNPPPEEPRDTVPAAPTPAPWQRTAGWVSSGIAVVLGGATLAAGLMANKQYEDFNNLGNHKCNLAIKQDFGGPECQQRLSTGDTYTKLALVAGIGAGVAAIVAVVFFVSAPSLPPHAETAMSCAPTLGIVGATCRMTF
jgi:PEGA domain